MSGTICPFCDMVLAIDENTARTQYLAFGDYDSKIIASNPKAFGQTFRLIMIKCPNCGKVSITYEGIYGPDHGSVRNIYPISKHKTFPEYIPEQIRLDYEEACSIVDLSPKASATLSRRCLQGMIRDFWGIKKSRLVDEIDELKEKVPADQWKVIDGLRRLGNIGAHMEKDINVIIEIDPDEAQKLIKLIEMLMKDWYINRHEQQQLYSDILEIDAEKQEQRKPIVSSAP